MQILVNGAPHMLAAKLTLDALLHQLGLDTTQVAVEHNQEIVPRTQHAQREITDGDVIEIVEFIGGG